MNKTRKNKIICYTGIGSRKNGKHNAKKYMKIVKKEYPKRVCNTMKLSSKKSNRCPKYTNLNGWVKYFGANYKTSEECDKVGLTKV